MKTIRPGDPPQTWNQAALITINRIALHSFTVGPIEQGINPTDNKWGNHRSDILTLAKSALNTLARRDGTQDWPLTLYHTLVAKQHDYGHNNILAFGHLGLRVRISDKLARITNLKQRSSEGRTEPLDDAYLDLAGYSVIWLMLYDGTFTLPLEGD